MKDIVIIHPEFEKYRQDILNIPSRFEHEGKTIANQRNVIKILSIRGMDLNVKSFKIPHIINRIAYAYIRPSKAERSYKYANLLLDKGVNTPQPIAYIIRRNLFGINRSYYISKQEHFDFEFRALRTMDHPDLEKILREFTRFTYHFHSQGIYFIDHSPGNTLIRKEGEHYVFSLVDLNRIKFMKIDPITGLHNFYRLNATDEMIDIIADEYALLTNSNPSSMSQLLKDWTHKHDAEVVKRQNRKK